MSAFGLSLHKLLQLVNIFVIVSILISAVFTIGEDRRQVAAAAAVGMQ